LRRADHSSKESYQLSISVRLRNLIRGGQGPIWAGAPYKKRSRALLEKLMVVQRVNSSTLSCNWNFYYCFKYNVFRLRPSSGILKTREHSVSETGCISVLRWRRDTPILLGPLERGNLNPDPVSKTLCSLVFGIPDDGHSSEHFRIYFYYWVHKSSHWSIS
jgi:hypothetical protein